MPQTDYRSIGEYIAAFPPRFCKAYPMRRHNESGANAPRILLYTHLILVLHPAARREKKLTRAELVES
jgi:hypothetical protein